MFDFKSSGIKTTDEKFKVKDLEGRIRPIGIATPLEYGNDKSELFKMHVDPIKQIADNLKNLVQTNNGERLGRYDIGCNFKSMLFDRNSQNEGDYEKFALESLQQQVKKYLPLVSIGKVTFNAEEKDYTDLTSLAKIVVDITFSIPRLRSLDNRIEVILYNGG